ncbi:hypothetical protein SAMN04515667_1224 [Formosa sp. Hel1_31_208]|nr:hypothetical protein [Formosa sp. Hel1_31_208]SDS01959.1 hypothetical protein SAMN04515667_1224 [Formosa sp. Hel1_31_208]
MKFIKEKHEKRRDYILQKDKKTLFGARFISSVLAILVMAVTVSYFVLSK